MRKLIALALICLPFTAAAQESDKDFITRFLEENLSSAGRAVTITGFAGALSSRATMAEMTIADDTGIWLTVKDVTLDWRQSALLTGQIVINEFSAGEIDLARMPITTAEAPAAEAKGFSLPNLPVGINIESINAPRIILGATVLGQPFEGALKASAQLAGGEGNAVLNLTRTDAGPSGTFGITADYIAETGALTLDLTAAEGAGGVAVNLLGVPGAPSADFSVKGTGPVSDFVADVALRTDGVMRLGGQVKTFQSEGVTGFEANLSGDPTPVFLPQYAEFFGPNVVIHSKGQRYADGRMELSALHVEAQALTLDGLLNLDADGVPASFSLTGKMGLPEGSVVLPLTTDRETRVYAADLSLNYSRIAGDIWQGKITVDGLDHAAFKAAQTVLSGSGHIVRDPEGPRFDGRIDFGTTGLAATDPALAKAVGDALTGQMVLNWASGSPVKVSNLSFAGDGFAVATTGAIGGLEEGFALTGTAQGQYDDLSRLADLLKRPLKGALSFDLEGTGSPLTGMADLTGTLRGDGLAVGIAQLDGLMVGETAITASVRRDEAGTQIRQLDLVARGLDAKATGVITSDGVDLKADFALADASVLGPGYKGALQGKASFGGPMASGLITLDATGTNLAVGQAQADGPLQGESRVQLALRLTPDGADIQAADVTFAKGSITATGRVGRTANDVTARLALTDLAALNLGLSGGITSDLRFTGAPDNGKLGVTAQAQSLALGSSMVDKLLRGASSLQADLDLTPQGIGITQLNIRNGQITVAATGIVTGTERRLQLEARLANLGLLYPQFPGPLVARGTATQGPAGYVIDLDANGPGQINASVRGTLASNFSTADLAISGTAAAGLANNIIAPRSLSGDLDYNLRIRGPITLSSISGTVNLSNGRIADPTLNLGLGNVTVQAVLAGGQARITSQASMITSGDLTLSGTIGLAAPMQANLAIQLNAVGLRDPDLYTTSVSGPITIAGPLMGGAVVSGRLDLGATELRIPSTGFGIDTAMADLKHVNESAASVQTRRRAGQLAEGSGSGGASGGFALDLRISAPSQVFIRGRGLDAELGGSLTLRGTTNAMIPSGAFNLIRGRLDILGRRLELSEALLQLQGAFVPYIRIVASIQSDDITAGVVIEGDASDPQVSFTSTPALPEEEVLARLLFDRGLDTLTAFQAIQLGSAVATLAGRGGEGIIGNLRKKAGLDNLDVTSDAAGATTVTVGKYLTDKIYTEVEVQQGKSAVSLNLDLAPHITLKGSVGADGQTGIGVFLQKDY